MERRGSLSSRIVSSYAFVTEWTFDAPVGAVWAELNAPEQWPAWWRGVVAVELLEAGDAAGVGSYRRMTWKSRLPYRLRFNMRTVRVDEPSVIEGVADGELCGVGRWTLTPAGNGTHVRYDWTVEATKLWMRALGPVARPVFEWNHDIIMRWGYDGLTKRLGARRPAATS
jgi:uncharacterized protein YndB with AHSA1/START domain